VLIDIGMMIGRLKLTL